MRWLPALPPPAKQQPSDTAYKLESRKHLRVQPQLPVGHQTSCTVCQLTEHELACPRLSLGFGYAEIRCPARKLIF